MKPHHLASLLALTLPLAAGQALSASQAAGAVGPAFPQAAPQAFPLPADPAAPPAEVGDVPIALLIDASSGQLLYSREADRRFVPASITKVMTLYVAFELLAKNQLITSATMRMSPQAYKDWHAVGSTMFLDTKMAPTVNDLLLGIANISANDACVVLAEGAAGNVPNWVALMNAEARRLGMNDSHFGTPNGWMDEGETFVTAHDLGLLANAMISRHPDYFHRFIGHETMSWNGITQSNHDPILGKLQGADGIKTGFTNQAGYGFLGTAQRGGRRLVMVIAGADSSASRARAARALMDWGFAAFSSHPVFAPGSVVGRAQVQGGSALDVGLALPRGFAALSRQAQLPEMAMRVVYQGPLEAPIAKGSAVAELEIAIKGQPTSRVPLYAADAVGRAGLLARLRNGVVGLVR